MKRIKRRSFRPSAEKRQQLQQRLAESGFDSRSPRREVIAKRDPSQPAPLSFAQQRLWFLDRLQPGQASYHLPLAVRLRGPLDAELFTRTLSEIGRRHEGLRTCFPANEGEPSQQVLAPSPVPVPLLDLSHLPTAERERQLLERVTTAASQPFDLATGPLWRVQLLRLEDREHVAIVVLHHIIADGWSLGVLQRELATVYGAFGRGEPSPLAELPIQMADFSAWQRRELTPERLEADLSWWRQTLAGAPPMLELPTDRPRPSEPSFRGNALHVTVPAATAERVAQLARELEATPFMVLLAAFGALLCRYSGQSQAVVGSPIANRGRPELEGLIGMFVNTLALPVDSAPAAGEAHEPNFRHLVERVKGVCLGAYDHQQLPFEKLVDELQPERDISHTPLFQAMLMLQNNPSTGAAGGELQLSAIDFEAGVAKFDLTLGLSEQAEGAAAGFIGALEYSTDLFDATTAQRFASAFEHLLEVATRSPETPLGDLPLLAPAERQLLLEWQTETPFAVEPGDPNATVATLVAAGAALMPTAVAVSWGASSGDIGSGDTSSGDTGTESGHLTYEQLLQRSHRLAHHLLISGLQPDRPVALSLQRSPELIVSLLAVLQAGGAYLPISAQPAERRSQLLKQAGVDLVIVNADGSETAAENRCSLDGGYRVIDLTRDRDVIAARPSSPPSVTIDPSQLAYVLFTSGSTGQPKGVMAPHRGVVCYLRYCLAHYGLGPGTSVPLHSSLSFDMTVTSLLAPLAAGGQIELVAEGDGIEPLARALETHGEFALLKVTPSHLEALSRLLPARSLARAARTLVLGGEALSWGEALATWRRNAPATRVINEYGPTETVVGCTAEELTATSGLGTVAIGRSIADARIYLLDQRLRPVPSGGVGELCVGGPAVVRGYLGQPKITAQSFVPDPWQDGQRLYRTGDLSRFRADGRLDYLGRADHQIKVRGYRIEPGEVESALVGHPSVTEAAVVAQGEPGQHKRLIAWITSPPGQTPEPEALRAFLLDRLPDYMAPSLYLTLDALPLGRSGKVDRGALMRMPLPTERAVGVDNRAPSHVTEQILATIWQQVLGIEQVGVDDDFFALGGDSILSIQIVARARRAGVHLQPRQVFQHPTIAGLANVAGSAEVIAAQQGPVVGPAVLTPIQRWYFEQRQPHPEHNNQAVFLSTTEPLEPAALAAALERLFDHHDALRLRFTEVPGTLQQVPGTTPEVPGTKAENVKNLSGSLKSDSQVPGTGSHESNSEVPGTWRQDFVAAETSAVLQLVEVGGLTTARRQRMAEIAEGIQASLDLAAGPVLRAVYFQRQADQPAGEDSFVGALLLVCQHLVIDGVSWRILLEDLATLYGQLQRGEEPLLPAKTTSFQTWADRLLAHADAPETVAELEHWQTTLAAVTALPLDTPTIAPAIAPMPTDDYEDPVNTVASEAVVTVELDTEATRELLQEVPKAYRTRIDEVLLTAVALAFRRWVGGDQLVVDVEGHGREDLFSDVDLSRTVGWFTSLYPVLLTVTADSLGPALCEVKEQLRQVPRRGIGFGLLRYLRDDSELQPLPSAQISFNYLGQVDGVVSGDSLWRPADADSGPTRAAGNRRSHLLALDGGIAGGRLGMRFAFSEALHQRTTIEQFAHGFLDCLRDLIAHCQQPGVGAYTPSDFPLARHALVSDEARGALETLAQGGGIEALYPLSPMQQGMLFHSLANAGQSVYLERISCDLEGDLDADAFRCAWQHVLDHRPLLRTAFVWLGVEEPLQVVREQVELPWQELDWRAVSSDQQSEHQEDLLRQVEGDFDLSSAPLLRLRLIRLAEQRYRLLFLHHHGLLDGWSQPLLFADLFAAYEALRRGETPELVARRPYSDYLGWLAQRPADAAESYWRKLLGDFERPSAIDLLRPTEASTTTVDHQRSDLTLDAAASRSLEDLARRHGLTLGTLIQGAWALLLGRLSGSGARHDVVFGVTTSGRPVEIDGVEEMLGLFINTLPLRTRFSPSTALLPWLTDLQEQLAASRQFEHVPLTQVQSWSGVDRHMELFDSLVVFENYPTGEALERRSQGLRLTGMEAIERTNYPLTLVASPGPRLALRLSYLAKSFTAAAVQRLLGHLRTLLEGLAEFGEAPDGLESATVADVPVLDQAQLALLLGPWAGERTPYEDLGLYQLFAERAATKPEATALRWLQERSQERSQGQHIHSLSYGQLQQQAHCLAGQLRSVGVGPEMMVGLFSDRRPEVIVAILAILETGAAFVPLDPSYPAERLAFMMHDAAMSTLVVPADMRSRLPEDLDSRLATMTVVEVTLRSGDSNESEKDGPATDIEATGTQAGMQATGVQATGGDSLAYVMYTSGSTGQPKGVAVSQRNVARLVRQTNFADLGPEHTFLLLAPLSFDASTLEIWAPLLNGGCLAIATEDRPSLDDLAVDLQRFGVTTLWLTSGLFHQMADSHLDALAGLQQLLAGGDVLSPPAVRRVLEAHPGLGLIDGYGPTENTTFTACHALRRPPATDRPIPIGRPITNTTVYVLDLWLRPMPPGVPGELYTGGDGVSRGYLNVPGLTAERFVPDPFGPPGGRLYRTGDLARMSDVGELHFLGRIDGQVKIRGFRIEPGEIESALEGHPSVAQVAVVAQPTSGGKRLVAFWQAAGATDGPGSQQTSEPVAGSELRTWLQELLPEHLVPAVFARLDALPLNANGKVDRRALAARDPLADIERQRDFAPPRSTRQIALAKVWSEVLGVEEVGLDDDFFELGGDSILSIQIVSRARREGLLLTPRQVFEHSTLESLAAACSHLQESTASDQGPVTGDLPLLPIQHWFFEQEIIAPHHWNQSLLLKLQQAPEAGVLERALSHLLEHHDALRLRFRHGGDGDSSGDGDGWQQWLAAPADAPDDASDNAVPFDVIDLANLDPAEQVLALERQGEQMQASLDLEHGPLLRAGLFDLGSQGCRLLLAAHHLAVDGVSWRLLLEDLDTLFRQLTGGQPPSLPPRTSSLQAWARHLDAQAQTDALAEEANYWLAPARQQAPRLPLDYANGRHRLVSTELQRVTLDIASTQQLLQVVPAAYRTRIDDLLLTALALALTPWTGDHRLLVDREGHGRPDQLEALDLTRTVGWLTSIHPLLLELPSGAEGDLGEGDLGEALMTIKEQVRALPGDGLGYGMLRYLRRDDLGRRVARLPEAQISFNYLGQLDRAVGGDSQMAAANEYAGPSRDERGERRYALEVSAQVQGSELQVHWQYSHEVLARATVEALAERYLASLQSLIEHCLTPGAGGVTPSDFPLANLDRAALTEILTPYDDSQRPEDIYPLSPLQQGMLLLSLAAPTSGVGFERVECTLEGQLDAAAFRRAWRQLVAHHPILRSSFAWDGLDQPLQLVWAEVEVPWQEDDWRTIPATEQDERWQQLMAADRRQGFDFGQAPLLRCQLVRTGDATHRFAWTYHHLLLDGWSSSRLIQQLLELYAGLARDARPRLEPARPYRDYIAWLQQHDLDQSRQYWRKALAGFDAPSLLASGLATDVATAATGDAEWWLNDILNDRLGRFAQQHRLTRNSLFQAALAHLLARLTGRADIAFGVTVSGRPPELDGVDAMVGLFINTLPRRVRLDPQHNVVDWLHELRDGQIEISRHEHTPFPEVQRVSPLAMGQPMFDTLLVYENYPVAESSADTSADDPGRLEIRDVQARLRANYPFTLVINPGPRTQIRLSYDRRHLDAAGAQQLLQDLESALEAILENADNSLSSLPQPRTQWLAPDAPGDEKPGRALISSSTDSEDPEEPRRIAPRDSIEVQLVALVEAAFGVAHVGVHDNFFELGGSSLIALHLVNEVRRVFDHTVPLSALFESPSVASLARHLQQQPGTTSPLVVIREATPNSSGERRQPFFCVHPGGGNAVPYRRLALLLGADRPFLAFQARGLNGEAPFDADVEAMAAAYLPALRAAQPVGPYLLGGWSFGGLVALEMAQRLIASGEEVALLAILDQSPFVPEQDETGYDDAALLRDILPAGLTLTAEDLRALGDRDRQLEYIVELGQRHGALPETYDLAQARRTFDVLELHIAAAKSYRAKPYSGPVTVFRADDQGNYEWPDGNLGWTDFTAGNLQIVSVPGNHRTMMDKPQLPVLAARLDQALNAVDPI